MRLLLAEDDRSLSRAVTALLERAGFSADAVYDGQEALDYLESGQYDGAVLDIMMPGMDGLSVLQKLREKGNAVPVLLLTARSEVEDKVLGLDTGADDYLTKPFHPKELIARVRAMTRTHTEVGNEVRAGNLTLNEAEFTLSSPSGSFRLTGKEFQMMQLLMRNPHCLFSAERFMEKIWGCDASAEINVVWVYISYLRKKLAALRADVQIKAVRGVGYSLEERV